MQYFSEKFYSDSQKQKRTLLAIYFTVLALYLALSIYLLITVIYLPYNSPKLTTVKLIQYPVTAVFVIFSFLFIGIPLRRVSSYSRLCLNILTGHREESEGTFVEYDESTQNKDGVEFKSLVFLEWNKYKKGLFERKVLVFLEKPFPEFKEQDKVRFVTQGNVLVSYEILQ